VIHTIGRIRRHTTGVRVIISGDTQTMPQNENRLWSRMRKGSGHYDEFIVLSPTTIIMHPIFTQGYTGDGVPKPGDMIAMGASPGLSWSVRSVERISPWSRVSVRDGILS